jgi:hypothetical protein
MTSRGNST